MRQERPPGWSSSDAPSKLRAALVGSAAAPPRSTPNLFAQIRIKQFLGFYLHARIVTLDRKVTRLVLGIIIRHHQLVIDPELNVLADCPDAIAKPFAVLGQQLGCLSRR